MAFVFFIGLGFIFLILLCKILLEKKEVKNKIKESDGIDNLSNDEAKNIIKKIYNLQEAQHENRIAFQENLFKFLSPKKILLLEISEHEFNKKLMSRLREKRGFRNGRII